MYSGKGCKVKGCTSCKPGQRHFCKVCHDYDSSHSSKDCPHRPGNVAARSGNVARQQIGMAAAASSSWQSGNTPSTLATNVNRQSAGIRGGPENISRQHYTKNDSSRVRDVLSPRPVLTSGKTGSFDERSYTGHCSYEWNIPRTSSRDNRSVNRSAIEENAGYPNVHGDTNAGYTSTSRNGRSVYQQPRVQSEESTQPSR